jgi:hypothetical protein
MSISLYTGIVDTDKLDKECTRDQLDAIAKALGVDPSKFTTKAQILECIRHVAKASCNLIVANKKAEELSKPAPIELGSIACKKRYRIDEPEPDRDGNTVHRCTLRCNLRWVGDNGCVGCDAIHNKVKRADRDAISDKNKKEDEIIKAIMEKTDYLTQLEKDLNKE